MAWNSTLVSRQKPQLRLALLAVGVVLSPIAVAQTAAPGVMARHRSR